MMRGTHHQGRQRAALRGGGHRAARKTGFSGTRASAHERDFSVLSNASLRLGRITSFPSWSGPFSLFARLSQNAPRYLSDWLEFRLFILRQVFPSVSVSPSLATEDSEGDFAWLQEK